jgi:hypothetical protein
MKKIFTLLTCLFLASLAWSQVSSPVDTNTITVCGSYTTNTGIVLSATGLYVDTIPNPGPIDSSFYIDLTIQAFINPILTVTAPLCSPNPSFNFTASSSNPLIQTFRWYDQPTQGSLINEGTSYTDAFQNTSSLYVVQAGLSAPTPAQTSLTTTGNTGGYWFVAPNTFVITSLFVPTLDSNKFQNIAVLKMDGSIPPPTASLSTNDFSTLYKTQVNNTLGAISVNIQVNAGDVIGILGSRESNNSRSNTDNYTIVSGDTILFTSFGFPGQLTTTNPYNVSSFPLNPNISRVSFEYTTSNICLNPSRTAITAVVLPTFLDTINLSVCDSFRLSPQGILYDYSTTIFDTLTSVVNFCDSIIRINLTVNYSSLDSIIVASCDSFVSPSGNVYFASGAFYDTTYYTSGCSNIKYINLSISNSYSDTVTVTACNSFTSLLGNVYTNDTTFTDTLQSVNSCDSVVLYNLVVNYSTYTVDTIMACDSYVSLSGTSYFMDTAYNDTLITALSCDSVVHRVLIVNYSTLDSLTEVACDSYLSPAGGTYTASAIFYDTLTTVFGCDSVIYVDLTVNYSTFEFLEPIVCDVYVSPNGTTYTSSAVFLDTLTTVNGCDSILYLNLTVNYKTVESIYPVVCDTFISPKGNSYNSSSIFTDILTTSNGCDSIIHVFLIVNQSTVADIDVIACSEYTSPNGTLYTSSTSFSDTLATVNGCDSILNINLSIVSPTLEVIQEEVCDSYVSPSGNLYTLSQVFNDTLTSINGCDSVLQINLTVNYSVFDTVYPAACLEYTSANNIIYRTSGIFTESYSTNSACDSIVTFVIELDPISLTINKLDGVLESLEFDASYQWFDCTSNSMISGETGRIFDASSNGTYAVILDNGECMDTSACVTINSIGTGIYWLNNTQLSLYPNPTKNQLFISSSESLNKVEYSIYDLNGRKILGGALTGNLNLVPVESLDNGMYLVVIDKLRIPVLKLD